jgi:hypothetical protein
MGLHRQMTEAEHRQISRDSLFVLADLQVEGDRADHKVKVRNLSAGGMMAEGPVKVLRGMPVSINLRNIGWVEGTVAWVQDSRFGIAFRDEIDPKIARAPVGAGETTPRFVRPAISATPIGGRLRKI